MAYFTHFGNVWYTLKDGSKILINDVTAFAQITAAWKKDARVQIQYSIADGELPHQLSYRLYGSVDFWWTILLMNNIYDFDSQWPRNQEQLDHYISLKYPNNNPDDVHHYVNPNGLVVDLISTRLNMNLPANTSDAQTINVANLEVITIREFETAVNDSKRSIALIDPDYINTVQTQFETSMEGTE